MSSIFIKAKFQVRLLCAKSEGDLKIILQLKTNYTDCWQFGKRQTLNIIKHFE